MSNEKQIDLKSENKLVIALIGELNQVNEKSQSLKKFLSNQKPEVVSDQEWLILHDQLDAMQDYLDCLLSRIAIHAIELDEKPLSPNHPDYKPIGLGSLGELDD